MSSLHWPIYNKLYPAFDSSWLDFDHLHWLSTTYCVSHCSLLTILTWCVQFEPFSPWTYSLQLSVWRGRDKFSYKPSSFIFQPLRRGLIQFTISFVSHFAFYLKHRTEFENELKNIEKYLKIKSTNIKYIQFLFFYIFQKNHNSRHL